MKIFDDLMYYAREQGYSDIHLTYGCAPYFRHLGKIIGSSYALGTDDTDKLIAAILTEGQLEELRCGSDVDFCYTLPTGERQRVNIYMQQGHLCAAIRVLNDKIPSMNELMLPVAVQKFTELPKGLVLVTGPTGSGKSTTLASMINHINESRQSHIVTIEDPIEYVHKHKRSIIHHREVGSDTESFSSALRSVLREDPDVILVGEMRDLETISAAITAAETGHLVFSTLHTNDAVSTVDRIIDVFPGDSKAQIRTQLAAVLKGIVSQQLLPASDGTRRLAAFEVLVGNPAIANLIRENKCHQIPSTIQTGQKEGMQTMDQHLSILAARQLITRETAIAHGKEILF